MKYWLTVLFFLAPLALYGAPATAPQAAGEAEPQNVEEPDASDADSMMESPKQSEETIKEKTKEVLPPPTENPQGGAMQSGFNTVILQGLNKVTGRASKIEAVMGSTVRFGTLEILAKSCWQAPPGERAENAALLEINEIKQGEPPSKIFLGWMFSSSPALSSLENPFYDVTVIKCDKVSEGKL